MSSSKLLSAFFSKWFFVLLLLLIFAGVLLFLRQPAQPYDAMLDFVSNLLKQKYGSGGNKLKIDTGFHKLSFLLMALGIMLFAFFSFWKWFIRSAAPLLSTTSTAIQTIKFQKNDWIIVSLSNGAIERQSTTSTLTSCFLRILAACIASTFIQDVATMVTSLPV